MFAPKSSKMFVQTVYQVRLNRYWSNASSLEFLKVLKKFPNINTTAALGVVPPSCYCGKDYSMKILRSVNLEESWQFHESSKWFCEQKTMFYLRRVIRCPRALWRSNTRSWNVLRYYSQKLLLKGLETVRRCTHCPLPLIITLSLPLSHQVILLT